jgi:alpha-L-fucosidase
MYKESYLTKKEVNPGCQGEALYAFFMGWPEKREVVVSPLATTSALGGGRISQVELLGFRGKLQWSQDEAGLKVELPAARPGAFAFALKINGPGLNQV